jgi:hypothetical protein
VDYCRIFDLPIRLVVRPAREVKTYTDLKRTNNSFNADNLDSQAMRPVAELVAIGPTGHHIVFVTFPW